jgi:flagellar assembly protein FliH
MTMRRLDSADQAVRPLWQNDKALPGRTPAVPDERALLLEKELLAARERGYREGYAEGARTIQNQLEQEAARSAAEAKRQQDVAIGQLNDAKARLQALLGAVSTALAEQVDRVDEIAVATAYAAVTKFLGDRYADRDLMQTLVNHALAHTAQRVDSIHVSEQDADLLQSIEGVRIVPDSRLRPGQCTLETRLGHYETGVDTRLELLKSALLAGLAQHRSADAAT